MPGAVAAEVHPDVDAPRAAGGGCGPEETGVTLANAFGKGLVDDAFSRHPAPQHIAVIKHACEGLLIPLDGLFGQSGVVSQHKMDVLGVDLALVCLFDPVGVEPMGRRCRVAGKPDLCPCDRAADHGLVHERTRLQNDLINQASRQRAALNQCIAAFILAAEHLKHVGDAALGNGHGLVGAAPLDAVALPGVLHRHVRLHDVLGCAVHGLAADAEAPAAEPLHGIIHKAHHHEGSLAGTHSTVTDQVAVIRKPELQNLKLLLTQCHACPRSIQTAPCSDRPPASPRPARRPDPWACHSSRSSPAG